jgi:hypothetical protein
VEEVDCTDWGVSAIDINPVAKKRADALYFYMEIIQYTLTG